LARLSSMELGRFEVVGIIGLGMYSSVHEVFPTTSTLYPRLC
jgi:hypothetical protein